MRYHQHNIRRYGLTIGQYEEILRDQGGLCAICGKPQESIGREGAIRQWEQMSSEEKDKHLEELQKGAKRYKLSMSPQEREIKANELKQGHRKWLESLTPEQRSSLADRINKTRTNAS
jgi:hypothetical protein